MEFEYITPGSPIDLYLESIGQPQEDATVPSLPEATECPSVVALVRSKIVNMLSHARRYKDMIRKSHEFKCRSVELESRKVMLPKVTPFLAEERVFEHEEALDRLAVAVAKTQTNRYDISLWYLAIPVVYVSWLSLQWSRLSLLILAAHAFIFILLLFLLLSLLRFSLLLHSLTEVLSLNVARCDRLLDAFQEGDRVLRKALRLLRDFEVVSRGFTVLTAPHRNKVLSSRLRSEIESFVFDISRLINADSSGSESDLDSSLCAYQQSRSEVVSALFLQLCEIDKVEIDELDLADQITSRIALFEKRLDTIRQVGDIEQKTPVKSESEKAGMGSKVTLLRSISLHAQILTRESFRAEEAGFDNAQVAQMCRHLRALNELFYLLQHYETSRDEGVQMSRNVTEEETQTDEIAQPLHLTKDDFEDDRVIEGVVDGIADVRSSVPASYDEIDMRVKHASGHVVSELKSVLPQQVNPEKRQERKRALFPEYWETEEREKTGQISDVILPEADAFSFVQSEPSTTEIKTENFDEIRPGERDDDPIMFDDERERAEGRRERREHAFCCSSENSSLVQVLARQVVAKSRTQNQAEEYLYDVEDD